MHEIEFRILLFELTQTTFHHIPAMIFSGIQYDSSNNFVSHTALGKTSLNVHRYKTMSYGQGICLIMCLFPMFIGFRSHRCRHHGMPCKILSMRMSKMLKTIVRFFSFDLEDENEESIESQTLYILPPFPGSPGPPSKIAYTPQSTSSQNNHSWNNY